MDGSREKNIHLEFFWYVIFYLDDQILKHHILNKLSFLHRIETNIFWGGRCCAMWHVGP